MGNRILAGRYELLEKIGDGGMAVVYKSRDRLLNRLVAIKILKPAYSKDAKFIENFRRESRAAASLSHPNIVSIYDVGWEGNINFIVMELVEGPTLADLIAEKGALPPRDAVNYAKQISMALACAHQHLIIHRDVKPHNVLLTPDGIAKLTDFGIAKGVDGSTIVGNTGTVLGSVHYLSPEQARGGYVDEKTDIYSLGIVLYEMLTGKVPFDNDNPVTVALMHINDEIVPPSEVVSDLPREIEAIVLKATQKYPVNRYKTAQEMTEALQNAGLSVMGIYSPSSTYEHETEEEPVPIERSGIGATEMLRFFDARPAAAAQTEAPDWLPKPSEAPVHQKTDAEKQEEFNRRLNELYQSQEPKRQRKKGIAIGAVLGTLLTAKKGEKKQRKPASMERKPAAGKKTNKPGKANLILRILMVLLAVLLGVALAFPISKGIYPLFVREKLEPVELEVPSLAGKTVEEAQTLCNEKGLLIVVGTEVTSYEYAPGQIVSQTPKAGNIVKTGQPITVNVSRGMSTVTMPSVIGMTVEDARFTLESYNFKVNTTVKQAYSSTVQEGRVCGQNPNPGSAVESKSTVTLTISSGKQGGNSVPVPYLTGFTVSEAQYQLEYVGLMLGTQKKEESTEYPEGYVIGQLVPKDSIVEAGTKIGVIVSSGPGPTENGENHKGTEDEETEQVTE